MLSIVELGLLVVFLYVILYLFSFKPKRKLPPGPWNIPFVSGIFTVGNEPHLTFREWAKIYGPLIRTKFGFADALIIDDHKLMREAFSDPAFNGRMDDKVFGLIAGGKHGIVNAEGREWAEQRRFVLRALRDFGFGKKSMENFILEEVIEFMKWMKEIEGVPTDAMARRFTLATTNSIWSLVAGKRYEQDDPFLGEIIDKTNDLFNESLGVSRGIESLFPKLINILPKMFFKKWYELIEASKPLIKMYQDEIDYHMKHPADESQPRDLIDVYLKEVKNTADPTSSFHGERGLKTLMIVFSDLYGAAQGTTSTSLTWTVLFLIRHPEVQRKLQRELDSVVGRKRIPTIADRQKLPYTEAMTLEMFRYASLAPLGLLHETMEDTTLAGYDIKKGTVVIPNLYSMSYNKDVFGDPENFRPERFLSADEKTLLKSENILPFGTGKRACPGETLGRDTLFLFLTCLYQRFEIGPDPANPIPTLEPKPGFFREPQNFSVIIKERPL